ncbi:hypothetical protein DFH09DRAFT_1084428 [Mycena vulgaris]|nr:hypothetical protein DFH09DRAFT_1084428 [Mycena vulgaris]
MLWTKAVVRRDTPKLSSYPTCVRDEYLTRNCQTRKSGNGQWISGGKTESSKTSGSCVLAHLDEGFTALKEYQTVKYRGSAIESASLEAVGSILDAIPPVTDSHRELHGPTHTSCCAIPRRITALCPRTPADTAKLKLVTWEPAAMLAVLRPGLRLQVLEIDQGDDAQAGSGINKTPAAHSLQGRYIPLNARHFAPKPGTLAAKVPCLPTRAALFIAGAGLGTPHLGNAQHPRALQTVCWELGDASCEEYSPHRLLVENGVISGHSGLVPMTARQRDTAGGDSGSGRGNMGKSDGPAEAKPGSITVQRSVKEAVNPYEVKKLSRGSTAGVSKFEGGVAVVCG